MTVTSRNLDHAVFFEVTRSSFCRKCLYILKKNSGDGCIPLHFVNCVTARAAKSTISSKCVFNTSYGPEHTISLLNTGKYHFILQMLILGLFTEVILISILMFSIQNLILIVYWYFQYFPVSVFYALNH